MIDTLQLNRRTVVQNIATLFSGSIVAQGMTALALLLAARQLGVDGYGQYAACVALTSITAILFSLGLDLWLLREGGRDRVQLPVYAGSVLGIKAILGVGWMAGFFLIAPYLKQETYPVSLLRWSVILIWLDNLLATALTAFKAALCNRVPEILEAGAALLWFGLTVVLIVLGTSQPILFLVIRIPVTAAALILGLFKLKSMIGLRYDSAIARLGLRNAFPFAASDFLAMVMMRADVVIVSLTLGQTATGLYSPAIGLVHLGFLAPIAIYLVAVPVLSNLFQNRPQQARRTSTRTILLSFGLGVCLTAGFAVGAPIVVKLLGPGYQDSVDIIRILSLVLLFKSGSYGMAAIILANDQQARRTLVQTVAAVINLLANLLVVYWVGIRGVAGVYVLTEFILLIGYSWIVWRKLCPKKS